MLNELPPGWDVVVEDESFIYYESISRRVWIRKGRRPVRLVTGSHAKLLVFGAVSLRKKQAFRIIKVNKKRKFNGESTLSYLRFLKQKRKKFVLFWDKATPHTDKRVQKYLKENEHCIKVVYFPTATPEANPTEECWRQTKGGDVVANRVYDTFEEFHEAISGFYKKKRFNLNLRNYLCQ